MALDNPIPASNFVAEYQVSGIPWVTSSSGTGPMRFSFGDTSLSGTWAEHVFVTQWVQVTNTTVGSNPLKVAFTQRGFSTSNFITLDSQQSFTGELRVTEIWVSGSSATTFEIIAGLTGIRSTMVLPITASRGFPAVG